MSYCDVIGYCPPDAGILLCPQCAGETGEDLETWHAILEGEGETDCPSHCDECGTLIPESLTSDGIEYVAEALRDYVLSRGTRGHAATLDAWRETYGDSLRGYGAKVSHTKTLHAFDKLRERLQSRVCVELVRIDGFARKYGEDAQGCSWIESECADEADDAECPECGTAIRSGWLLLDGGDLYCREHVSTEHAEPMSWQGDAAR